MKRCGKFLLRCFVSLAAVSSIAPLSGSVSAQEQVRRDDQRVSEEAARQIQEIAKEKRARTPTQKKIDSQLLYAIKQKRGETWGVPTGRIDLKLDAQGRALVDISAQVSAKLISKIRKLGGDVISKSEKYHTIRAGIALEKLEALAEIKVVMHISPAAQAMTHGGAMTN